MNSTEKFIESKWHECIKKNTEDNGTLIGLPYPYTVPAVGHFDEMYYWDTYFTNVGLIAGGHLDLAKNNADNMIFLINKYGFMPNGNRTYYLNRSQPPFFSEMVRDIYAQTGDKQWLNKAYDALEKEYSFWQNKRSSPIGLNVYGGTLKKESIPEAAKDFKNRVGYLPPCANDEDIAKHMIVCCESGWDVNPRWGTDGYNFAPVDLNSLMYLLEENMQYFADELGFDGDSIRWCSAKKERKRLMLKYMMSDDGVLTDYDFVNDSLSNVFSAASFYPLFAGVLDKEDAEKTVNNLYRLEMEYGISTCEPNNVPGTYQWDYPNGWACIQYLTITGLLKYGYTDDAKRIAEKYILLVDKTFSKTGNLWEKYNVADGSICAKNEYEMPPMLGWTAGVYLKLIQLVKQ